jgi:membrane-bound metal-dependent hydrolase YbcI (DUF457 family)
MRWVSHKAIGASIGILLGFPLYGVVVATLFSVFPDFDMYLPVKHRGITHSLYMYPVAFLAFRFVGIHIDMDILQTVIKYNIDFYIMAGCVIHIFCDMLTVTPVPVLPNLKISFGLFKTGSFLEYIFVACMVSTAFFYLAFWRGYL